MLDKITLQAEIEAFNDLVDFLTGGGIAGLPIFISILIVLGSIAGLIVGYRIWANESRYVKDTGRKFWKLGMIWMSKREITGMLSENESIFTEENFRLIKANEETGEELKIAVEDLEQKVKDKKIWIYDFKLIDWNEFWDSVLTFGQQDAIIISSAPIHSEYFYWRDQKGERNATHMIEKEYMNNIAIWSTSQHFQTPDKDKNKRDVFVIVPIPIAEVGTKKYVIGENLEAFGISPTTIIVTDIGFKEQLADAGVNLKTAAESYKTLDIYKKRIEGLEKINKNRTEENIGLSFEKDALNAELIQQELISAGRKEKKTEQQFAWVWIVAVFLAAILPMFIFPEIPELEDKPPVIGSIIGLFVVILIKVWQDSKRTIAYETTGVEKQFG